MTNLLQGLLCDGNDIIEMKENNLLRVAVITQNLLRKSKEDIFYSLEHLNNNNVQPQNHVCASLTRSSSSFEKLSTAFCLLAFFSINLLLYVYPIPY